MSGSDKKGHEVRTYVIGYVLALALTGGAFALVCWPWLASGTTMAVVFALALVQVVVHFRCFLHIGLRRSSRDDFQLILFSALIIVLMVSGTIVLLRNLHERMM